MKIDNFISISLAFLLFYLLVPVAMAEPQVPNSFPKINGVSVLGGLPIKLHAATEKGLYVSKDGGNNWQQSYQFRLPATMISTSTDGSVFAFVVGKGLLRLGEDNPMWQPVYNQFGAQVLTQLSVAENNPNILYGLNQFGRIIVSENSGKEWHRATGKLQPGNDAEQRGLKLFTLHCQSCHGVDGVGETYAMEALTNKDYIMAPPMDDSTHAWHHTDDALVKTILDGSSRTERMIAWKKQGLTEQNARDLVAYIKSLWGKRALECQGPKHMQCM